MVLEDVYEVVTRFFFFRRCLKAFANTCEDFTKFSERGLEGFPSVFKYPDTPCQAVKLYLYVFLEDAQ